MLEEVFDIGAIAYSARKPSDGPSACGQLFEIAGNTRQLAQPHDFLAISFRHNEPMIRRSLQCADAAADVIRATRGAVTRGQSRKCAVPQQSEMPQDEAERRVVIHYSGSSTTSGALMLTYVSASCVVDGGFRCCT